MIGSFITGEQFVDVGDFVFTLNNKGDCNPVKNTLNLHQLKNDSIIYTHTMYVKELFKMLSMFSFGNLILVTHNCDLNVDSSYVLPGCFKYWFAQNVNVAGACIESIPIGLENSRWFKKVHKKEKMLQKLAEQKRVRNLVYLNHNIATNPKERYKPYDVLSGKQWVTMEKGTNGNNFDDYLDSIYNHKFVVCPQGNGIDTHRTWECLYMGTIPIEKRNINNRFYTSLPICFVDDWEELTERFLEDEYYRIKHITWKMELLYFEYWKNRILQKKLVTHEVEC